MDLGTHGHWSAGDSDHRIHPGGQERQGLWAWYTGTGGYKDAILSNGVVDSGSTPYASIWGSVQPPSAWCPGPSGTTVNVSYSLFNGGNVSMTSGGPLQVCFYYSFDTSLNIYVDTLAYTRQFSNLDGGVVWTTSDSIPIPTSLNLNTDYYIIAWADCTLQHTEEFEDNNKLVLTTRVHTPNAWQCP